MSHGIPRHINANVVHHLEVYKEENASAQVPRQNGSQFPRAAIAQPILSDSSANPVHLLDTGTMAKTSVYVQLLPSNGTVRNALVQLGDMELTVENVHLPDTGII